MPILKSFVSFMGPAQFFGIRFARKFFTFITKTEILFLKTTDAYSAAPLAFSFLIFVFRTTTITTFFKRRASPTINPTRSYWIRNSLHTIANSHIKQLKFQQRSVASKHAPAYNPFFRSSHNKGYSPVWASVQNGVELLADSIYRGGIEKNHTPERSGFCWEKCGF